MKHGPTSRLVEGETRAGALLRTLPEGDAPPFAEEKVAARIANHLAVRAGILPSRWVTLLILTAGAAAAAAGYLVVRSPEAAVSTRAPEPAAPRIAVVASPAVSDPPQDAPPLVVAAPSREVKNTPPGKTSRRPMVVQDPAKVEAPIVAAADPIQRLRAQISSAANAEDRSELEYRLAKKLLEVGQIRESRALFERLASEGGRRAELAGYEVGRISLRHLGDPHGALAAFDLWKSKFPNGALAHEVEVSRIEAMLAAKELAAAENAIGTFLKLYPDSERASVLRLARANVLRDRGNCAAALGDYDALRGVGGSAADDAHYYTAYCAQQLGDWAKARDLLRAYLTSWPDGRHRIEAERALRSP